MKKNNRIYTRPYVGILIPHTNPGWWDSRSADDVNKDLISKGLHSLTMKQGRLGLKVVNRRYVFRYHTTPIEKDFPYFAYVIGPFRTARAAYFMAEHGENNIHCQTVCDAEKLANIRGE